MKYEIIIFDADETLFDFKKSEREALKETMIEFGVEYDEDYHLGVYKPINAKMWSELEQGLTTQEKLKTERFKRFFIELKLDFNEFDFAKSYMNNLARASFLYDDSMGIIKDLSKEYKLMIITNGLNLVQSKRIKESVIAPYFDKIVISENVGVSKPDPYIFEYSLKDIPYIDKENILIVGDSLSSDIQGGYNFGIDTCWFNPKQKKNDRDITPTYEIYDLKMLSEIL